MLGWDLATPADALGRLRPRPRILKLPIEESFQSKIPAPRHPPGRRNKRLEITMYENRPRVLLPRPPQEVLVHFRLAVVQRHVLLSAIYQAVLEHETGRLSGVGPALSCDGVVLALLGLELSGTD